jgi:hypothetical protein
MDWMEHHYPMGQLLLDFLAFQYHPVGLLDRWNQVNQLAQLVPVYLVFRHHLVYLLVLVYPAVRLIL